MSLHNQSTLPDVSDSAVSEISEVPNLSEVSNLSVEELELKDFIEKLWKGLSFQIMPGDKEDLISHLLQTLKTHEGTIKQKKDYLFVVARNWTVSRFRTRNTVRIRVANLLKVRQKLAHEEELRMIREELDLLKELFLAPDSGYTGIPRKQLEAFFYSRFQFCDQFISPEVEHSLLTMNRDCFHQWILRGKKTVLPHVSDAAKEFLGKNSVPFRKV